VAVAGGLSVVRGENDSGALYQFANDFRIPVKAPAPERPVNPGPNQANHIAWVWQFEDDGSPERIRSVLARNKMSIALKTHDATRWMARFDNSVEAVTGPHRVEQLARYFEAGGVPFHAWCVVHGKEPEREAWMCADVLSAGARSIIIDLEPYPGFWQASSTEAKIFGAELRRRHPNAWVSLSIDPRPWLKGDLPLSEFAAFSNEFAPQVYWHDFSSPANVVGYLESGMPPGPDGITPQFALNVAFDMLKPYGLPIQPIGQGSIGHEQSWKNFVSQAFARGANSVGVWRFGVTAPDVWTVLAQAGDRAAFLQQYAADQAVPS
jgi:hypothetical protein